MTSSDFDYSTPEAQEALQDVTRLILEIREMAGIAPPAVNPLQRKVAIYERTLGLAVIPVMLRRASYAVYRRVTRKPVENA